MTATSDPALQAALRRAEGLIAAAHALSLALDPGGTIELPPVVGPDVDQAQIRAIATLYLSAELEHAGLVDAAEGLMRLAQSGAVPGDLDGAAPLIEAFWRSRNEHPSSEERLSFFARLFGGAGGPDDSTAARNQQFEDLLIDLCEALYKLDELPTNQTWGGVAQQSRVHTAAEALLVNLTRVANGVTAFMAQEILALVRAALAILGHTSVRTVLAARSTWDAIDAVDRHLRRPLREHDLFIRRGQSGMTVLAWLAEAAPLLASDAQQPLVGLDHPVVLAAADWLQASLSLSQATASAAPPPAAGADASSWAALAQ